MTDRRDIGAAELMKEMVQIFGLRRTSELLGYAVIWTAIGEPDPELAVREQLGHRTSHYRALADLKRLAEKLRAEGKLPPREVEDSRQDARELMALVATVGGGAA